MPCPLPPPPSTRIDEEFIWRVFVQVALALKECHRHREVGGSMRPIIHRDIKPGNVSDSCNTVGHVCLGGARTLSTQPGKTSSPSLSLSLALH